MTPSVQVVEIGHDADTMFAPSMVPARLNTAPRVPYSLGMLS